jgi:predicted TIM-barrel fold metal-dependent hydrolase
MKSAYKSILSHLQNKSVVSTHAHHREDAFHSTLTLTSLFAHSYVNWCGVPVGDTPAEHKDFLDKVRYKSYFVWLEKALQQLYGFSEPITAENWTAISGRIATAHRNPEHHLAVMREQCGYRKVILDAYWNPGDHNGHPDLFTPTFRVDAFFSGYDPAKPDHDGVLLKDLFGQQPPDNPEDFSQWMDRIIRDKKASGCVALKCAIAYERDLLFHPATETDAAAAFERSESGPSAKAVRQYQDWLFHEVCRMAAKNNLPLQIHTGLGQLYGTRPLALLETIRVHPQTRFVLFHCGFPWTNDINALLHACSNVYPDLCWVPLLSPTAATQVIRELVEIGTADKLCWGCDTWTAEESLGARMALNHTLSRALGSLVKENYFSLEDAFAVADNILSRNAAALYGI